MFPLLCQSVCLSLKHKWNVVAKLSSPFFPLQWNYNMKCSVSIFKGDTVFFIPPMPEKSCSLKTAVTLVWKPPLFHRSMSGAILWSSEQNNSKSFFPPASVSLSRPQGRCLVAIPWPLTSLWSEASKLRIWTGIQMKDKYQSFLFDQKKKNLCHLSFLLSFYLSPSLPPCSAARYLIKRKMP